MLAQPPKAKSNAFVSNFISTPSMNILKHSGVTYAVLSV
jgi:ABC-type sugar transport system ATPase subunit